MGRRCENLIQSGPTHPCWTTNKRNVTIIQAPHGFPSPGSLHWEDKLPELLNLQTSRTYVQESWRAIRNQDLVLKGHMQNLTHFKSLCRAIVWKKSGSDLTKEQDINSVRELNEVEIISKPRKEFKFTINQKDAHQTEKRMDEYGENFSKEKIWRTKQSWRIQYLKLKITLEWINSKLNYTKE